MPASTVIQLKRTTTGSIPSSTEQGELFYVYDTSDVSAGAGSNGKRLFIGNPTLNTNTPIKIGGQYYTDLLDHTHGTLTADTAIIVDDNKAIDDLYIGNNATTGGSLKFNEGLNNGSNYISLKAPNVVSANVTFTLPSADGSSGQAMITNGSGVLSFANISSQLTIQDDASATDSIDLASGTLIVAGTDPVQTSIASDTLTISIDDATTTAKGIASFDTNDFSVTSGAVSIKSSGVSNTQLVNDSVTIGTDTVALGATLSAFTSLDVDNVNLNGNTISTTDTDGDLTLAPDGEGTILVPSGYTGRTGFSDDSLVPKAYVDAVRTGLDFKDSVRVATTENITLSNTQTIDGVSLSAGDRVLVKNQTTGSENGIYVVVSGASWTRSTDADNSPAGEVTSGMFAFVEEGDENANTGWVLATDGAITLDTTELVFAQFSNAGSFTAGAGLSRTGNTINVGGTADRITVGTDTVDIAATYVGQASITTLGTIATGTWNATEIGVAYGGTGLTSYTSGDLIYASGTTALSKLAAGADGTILYSNAGTPAWTDTIDGGTYS